MTVSTEARNAGLVGRILRLMTGIGLLTLVYFSVRNAGTTWILPTVMWLVGMLVFYLVGHLLIQRFVPNLNRWIGAVVAAAPAGALMFSGIGVAQIAALSYVGISLLLDSVNGDGGCEVMALPGLFTGKRTHLVCIAFSPFDWAESRLTGRNRRIAGDTGEIA